MPFIPVPRGRGVVQVAALVVVLVVIVLLLPVWLLCWIFPSGRELVLRVLQELKELFVVILAPDPSQQGLRVDPEASTRRPPRRGRTNH